VEDLLVVVDRGSAVSRCGDDADGSTRQETLENLDTDTAFSDTSKERSLLGESDTGCSDLGQDVEVYSQLGLKDILLDLDLQMLVSLWLYAQLVPVFRFKCKNGMCASSTSVLSSTFGRKKEELDRRVFVPFARVMPGSSIVWVSGEVEEPRDLMTSPYMDLMADFWAGVMEG
jgi:hypothetical protein